MRQDGRRVVERGERVAGGGDPRVGEAVPRRGAPAERGPAGAQVDRRDAVGAPVDGGVQQVAVPERPGAAVGGRDVGGAVDRELLAGGQVGHDGAARVLLLLVLEHHDGVVLVEQRVATPARRLPDQPLAALGPSRSARLRAWSTVSVQPPPRVTVSSSGPGTRCQSRRACSGSSTAGRSAVPPAVACLVGDDEGSPLAPSCAVSVVVGLVLGVVSRAGRGSVSEHPASARTSAAAGTTYRFARGIRRRCSAGSGPGWRGSSCRRCATGPGRCRARTGRTAAGSTARSSRSSAGLLPRLS